MKFTIQKATIGDYEGICKIYEEGDKHHFSANPKLFLKPFPFSRSKEFIKKILTILICYCLIAESESQIISILQMVIKEQPENPPMKKRTYGHIQSIIVSERFRNQGIGQALIKEAEQWTKSKGMKEIELGVFEFNSDAIRLYERLGYKTVVEKWRNTYFNSQGFPIMGITLIRLIFQSNQYA